MTPLQVDARMRHASLALLGAAVQLDYLGDVAGGPSILAAPYATLTSMTRRTLVHAEEHRRQWCERHGLEFVRIDAAEVPDPI